MDLGVYLVNMVLRESVSRFFHPFRPEISILVSVKCFKGKKGKRRFRIYHFQRLLLTSILVIELNFNTTNLYAMLRRVLWNMGNIQKQYEIQYQVAREQAFTSVYKKWRYVMIYADRKLNLNFKHRGTPNILAR